MMKKKVFVCFTIAVLILLSAKPSEAQQQKLVKNVIMMIPDGTCSSVLSLARWYKNSDNKGSMLWLAVDKYICGFVKTYSSNAPIGDSAPTSSCYSTGYLSQTKFIATYPPVSANDLVKVDPARAYQPLFTVLEAAKLKGKSTGIVVTCQFPHATPADFTAHTPYRDQMYPIAKQMVYNKLNVVLAGGTNYLLPSKRDDKVDLQKVLISKNYKMIDNLNQLNSLQSSDSLVWGMFADDALPNDIDRNKEITPSLAEMTDKALNILSQNKKGFFVMVEGSKVDWSAHDNDPVGIITEFLAFDKAVDVAMNFAKKNGNTAVIICPDHGNSGVNIGNLNSNGIYDELSLQEIIQPLKNCQYTAEAFYTLLKKANPDPKEKDVANVFKNYYGIDAISIPEANLVLGNISDKKSMTRTVAKIITSRTYIGFNSNGHTGEDVFLAVYHPANYRPTGVIQNDSINHYICDIMGFPKLDQYTNEYFCIDSVVFKDYTWSIDTANGKKNYPLLKVSNPKNNRSLSVDAYTDYYTLVLNNDVTNAQIKKMPSVAVFEMVKNSAGKVVFRHFFVPKSLRKELE